MGKVWIMPEFGKEYLIYNSELSLKAFYLGINPVKTPAYFRILQPEGHTFARINENKEMENYCTRTSEPKILLMWNSDGEDGPSWPAGFPVSKVISNLSKLEKDYISERIKNWSASTK